MALIPLLIYGLYGLIFLVDQSIVGLLFNIYMMTTAGEQWGWWEDNWIDSIFEWILVEIENNMIINIL